MFLTELSPLVQELTRQPVAFVGGFVSGLLRLNLADDPVRGWLDRQMGTASSAPTDHSDNGKSGGPQSIDID
jgi:hypothetical protein